MPCRSWLAAVLLPVVLCCSTRAWAEGEQDLRILFLGDQGQHHPAARFRQLQPVFASRGIALTYTDRLDQLDPKTLAGYDGLMIYANHPAISADQLHALLDYVAGGKGLILLHCASYCFLNSPEYIALTGAQFERHGTGVFRTNIAAPDHSVMQGFRGFESWDETYVHHLHNEKDRTVLETRTEGDRQEPWTWIRTQGRGRVFYTAWGHDERTWGNPGFQNLVERGTRWAAGKDPAVAPPFLDTVEMTDFAADARPFEYVPATIPFYPPSKTWGELGPPLGQMQKPLEAAESVKHMVTPRGFKVELFAAEPDLVGKPIAMNWDERGRLWVCETVDYPNKLQPPGQGHDRIRICRDTDGDGRADQFTVFAEGLSIPTSIAFHRGGVIVHQAPDTLFLKDTNGDDVADVRQVLFTGWHTDDTHAGPSNLRYGHDNWYYSIVGYAGFSGTVGGEAHEFRSGFLRFQLGEAADGSPQVRKLEFLRSLNNNAWGLGLSEEGILFGSTANNNPSDYMPIANRFYEAVRGWSAARLEGIAESPDFYPVTRNVRQVDFHGHFTAAAGHALYTARVYPREYWNRTALVTDPTGHLVATLAIQPDGAGFRSRNAWNLLASRDEWSAPIMAEVGPDGNVWVIDWYNFIVQHNPIPAGFQKGQGNAYETELRDKTRGRIYRLAYSGTPADKPLALDGAPASELVAALSHPNMTWRLHAQRLLIQRGQRDVVPTLVKLAHDAPADAIGINPGAMHALWTLAGLGALDATPGAELLAAARKNPAPGVRRAAALCTPRTPAGARALAADAAGSADHALAETDPQVKLAIFLSIAEMPDDPATSALLVPTILAALSDPANCDDRWLADALSAAAARHGLVFLEQAVAGPRQETAKMLQVVGRVADHVARGKPTDGELASLVTSLSTTGTSKAISEALLAGLVRGTSGAKPKFNPAEQAALLAALPKLSPAARVHLISLGMKWGLDGFASLATERTAGLLAIASDRAESTGARVDAVRELIDFQPGDAQAAIGLVQQIEAKSPPELAAGLLTALRRSQAREPAAALIERMDQWTPQIRKQAFSLLLARVDWTEVLLAAAENGQASLDELALDQKQVLAAHPDRAIARRAAKLLSQGGGLADPDRQKVVDQLLPLAKMHGDAGQGKQIFQKQCAKCHTLRGEGTKIGPDLTGMAFHPKPELLTQIFDPSRSVEGNYRVYTLVLDDGRTPSGLLASESKTALELIDVEGKRQAIQRDEIERIVASQKSLMPEGFEKQLTPAEIVNLLEFLTEKGKFVPLAIDQVATIVTTKGMFQDENATVERLIFPDWKPKTFAGVPFVLIDPQGTRTANAIMLYGNSGTTPKRMPKSVSIPCQLPVKTLHLLSGVSGWGFPVTKEESVSLTVRLHYQDRSVEDHPLRNGIHFADYIRRVDVPESQFAFALGKQQIRYLAISPKRAGIVERIEMIKGPDRTVPVIMAITVETP